MRIISYNILDGGEGRADPLAEILLAQKPDIVALAEADNTAVLDRLSRRLGMDYIVGPGPGKHAVALFSRWSIGQSINHAAIRGVPPCLLEAVVNEPAGGRWVVGVTHLSARAFEADEVIREGEARALLDVFAEYRRTGQRHILAGDFNANSPIQQIDPAQCKPKTREAWQANGGQIPRRVVQLLLDAGYVDSLAAVAGPAATTAGSFTTQYPGQRIDYLFTYGFDRPQLKEAWIEQDRLARYASDHLPIGLEMAGVGS
jgi:endonuclease/exonuclease/phosphatase family metal-dependent hydrolase